MPDATIIPLDPARITAALVDLIAQQLTEVAAVGRRLGAICAELDTADPYTAACQTIPEVGRLGEITEELTGNIWLALFGDTIPELEAPR